MFHLHQGFSKRQRAIRPVHTPQPKIKTEPMAYVNLSPDRYYSSIDRELEQLAEKDVAQSGPDAAELHSLREERLNTEKCLRICASYRATSIQLISDEAGPSRGSIGADASPETATNEGLPECKNSLAVRAAKLEKHMRDIMDRLLPKSETASTYVELY
ncbi:hypothetical protein N7522_001943 [Penicillium canescens]|nr:hypothetical protein N7522_001943 [Penicillium canescens]